MPKSEASKRWDAKNIKVLSVGLRTAEALEVNEAAIDAGLSVKGWLRAIIRKELERRRHEDFHEAIRQLEANRDRVNTDQAN